MPDHLVQVQVNRTEKWIVAVPDPDEVPTEQVIDLLNRALVDLDDASGVVDPGQGEERAYGETLRQLVQMIEDLGGSPQVRA